MRGKTYRVHLTQEEQQRLNDIMTKGVHPARQIRRAHIVLLLNEGADQAGKPVKVPEQSDIAEQCRCTARLVYMVGKQYVQEGLERVLNRKKRETPPVPAKVRWRRRSSRPVVVNRLKDIAGGPYGSWRREARSSWG